MDTRATCRNPPDQRPDNSQNGNGHGGKREGAGRPTNAAKAAQFAANDKLQPTINYMAGKEYARIAKSGERRLTKEEALLKRAYEHGEKERREQRRAKQAIEVAEATAEAEKAAQSLIDLYQYCRSTQEAPSDDDDDEDYELGDQEEDHPESTFLSSSPRKRMQYQPPEGSTLELFLTAYQPKLTSSDVLQSGKKWFHLSALDSDLVNLDDHVVEDEVNDKAKSENSNENTEVDNEDPEGEEEENKARKNRKRRKKIDQFSPYAMYCQEVEVYLHAPMHQHVDLIKEHTSELQCPHCKRKGNLITHSWHYRPAHKLDSVVWVLHERLVCTNRYKKTGCGKTFATFHRDFMKQLPNAVTEAFPFLMTQSGVGMHQSLMHMFMELCTKGILFSAFASSVNASKQMKYWGLHLNHLDRAHDRKLSLGKLRGFTSSFFPKPFSPYNHVGEYNGIDLKPSLVRFLFLQTMKSIEDYLQVSFQMNLDESEAPDHSFKFAKMVMSIIRTGLYQPGR